MRERREKRTNIPPTGETDGQTQAGRTGWKGEKETAGRGGEEDCGPMTDALVYSIESDRQTHFDLNTAALLHAHPRRLRLPPSLPPSPLVTVQLTAHFESSCSHPSPFSLSGSDNDTPTHRRKAGDR